ncbi:indole-3-glycerol phosphate synthase TrpC [Cryomorpha ignava]|uniref:indole-3-glycerol-phosphate synthase n=1 Tax=Cryomorpha ignava TaxID=101383 RepID=A0A7K3WV28_9FLAO|nr:indole-3-glycerol phosphate synthase TrpC [Cryomorpha ignava]NEN24901.1 indole-3-glycerol phosphate synthase TrpC [Cryomorpha ignava]
MSILETIKAHKIKEVAERKSLYPLPLLEKSIYFGSPCVSLKQYITDPERTGIIAEFKRKSPSKGDINKYANVEEVTLGYMQAGVSALSVLTDTHFFGAKPDDLPTARKFNYCPILRKDFILDAYQIYESKSMGADAILLIAKMLDEKTIIEFREIAQKLGMEVLLETQNEEEVKMAANSGADLVGINNRDLSTFDVDVENSMRLAELLPKSMVKVAESGIESAATIKLLKANGFDGFLIGEYFMRHSNPAAKCSQLMKELRR